MAFLSFQNTDLTIFALYVYNLKCSGTYLKYAHYISLSLHMIEKYTIITHGKNIQLYHVYSLLTDIKGSSDVYP